MISEFSRSFENLLGGNRYMEHRGKWNLSHLKLTSDRNPTFVIGDPMKKVHKGKNNSLVSSASTKFISSLSMM